MTPEIVLRLTDVRRTYQVGDSEIVALADVDLEISRGEFLAIVGPSGSGKSTLLQIIALLDRPTSGRVEVLGQDVGRLSDRQRTRVRLLSFGFIFQRFHLLKDLTALENVALPMEGAGVSTRERYERSVALLTEVGLGDRLDFRPARLSGGQRQRVAIARAFANQPQIVFADEPTGELHSEDKAVVLGLFRRFNRAGHTLVMVTHDPEVARAAHRQLEIRDGRIREIAAV